MSAFTHRFQLIAGKEIDDRTATGRPVAHAQRRSLLTGVSAAALVLDPAATLARWAAAFARAAKAFFLARLRAASTRRAISPRAKPATALRWTRVFAAFALLGTAWTVTPAGAATAAPDCTDQTCSTGDVSLDTTAGGTGTTTVGISNDGSLGIGGDQTYTTGTLVVGASGNSGSVTVYPGATLNDDAVIGDDGAGTFTNNGTQNVSGNLILGNQSTGSGTYTVDGSGAQTYVNFVSGGNNGSAYPVNGANANANGALIIGNYGTGSFKQGGTGTNPTVNVAGDVVLGYQGGGNGTSPDSVGTYTLNDGGLTIGGKLVVGGASQANNQFIQNGGSVLLTGSAGNSSDYIGVANNGGVGEILIGGSGAGMDGGTGTYTLNAGTVEAGIIEVGHTGIGTFNQFAGTATADYTLWIGNSTGSSGTYNLSGGTLSVGTGQNGGEQVGIFGTGYFNQTGGTNNSNGAISIGNGTYTLSGGALKVVGSDNGGQSPLGNDAMLGAIIGYGNGALVQTGGTATFGTAASTDSNSNPVAGNEADMVIGLTDGSQGAYALGATGQATVPTATVYGSVIIGQGGDENGISNTNTIPDSGSGATNPNLIIQGDGTQFNVHYNGDGVAYDGTLAHNAQSGNLIVGLNGNGAVTQTDGSTVNVDGAVVIGASQGGAGSYTMTAGPTSNPVLNVGQNLDIGGITSIPNGALGYFQAPGTTGGVGGVGVFNQNGGDVNVAADVNIGSEGGTGVYNLTAGALTADAIFLGQINPTAGYTTPGSVGTFNQSGGLVTTNLLMLGPAGSAPNYQGYYNLTGTGVLNVSGDEFVSYFGYGQFIQGDGNGSTANTVGGTLAIGEGVISKNDTQQYLREGFYTLLDGTLTTGATIVGDQGRGYFTQGGVGYSGGTHTVNGMLDIGAQYTTPDSGFGGASYGEYDIYSGTLNALGQNGAPDAIVVGDAGTGVFNQAGGAVTTGVVGINRGDAVIGAQSTGNGTYTLGDSTNQTPSLQVFGDMTIGRDAGSNAGTSPDVPGQTLSNPNLVIAGDGTTLSVNQYTGHDSQYGGNLVVGLNGNGAVTQTDQSTVYLDHNLVLGANADPTIPYTAMGSYTLNATSVGSGGPNNGYNLFVGSDLDIGGMQTDSYGSNFQTTANGGTGAFNLNSGDAYVVGNVNVGNNDGTGTLNITGGTLTVGLNENGSGMNVGFNSNYGAGGGSGTVTQTGGVVSLGNPNADNAYSVLNIGNTSLSSDAATGSYTITGTNSSSLAVYGNADVGVSPGGTGTLTIGTSGGSDSPTVSINSTGNGDGDLTIGDGGTGTLNMNSGLLHTDSSLTIGVNGLGTVNQTGGTISTGYVNMSFPAGSGVSVYNLSGGELDADYVNVGFLGSGTSSFNQSGGKVDASFGGLTVNDVSSANPAHANYNLSGGELDTGYTNIAVGGGTPAVGSFTQSGGTHNVQTSLILGYNAGDYGLYTMTGGTLNTGISSTDNPNNPYNLGDVIVGYRGTGVFSQSGGTVDSQSINGVTIGWGGTGTYNLTGTGSLSVAGNLDVGVGGQGAFNQGDGSGLTSVTVAGALLISSEYGGPASSYTLTDGTLRVAGVEAVGLGAQGAFTQTGGTNNANGGISLGTQANLGIDATQFGAGTYTLGGTGTLIVGGGGIFVGDGAGTTGVFKYNTLAGDAATLNFAGAGESLVVGNAGAGTLNIGSAANPTDLDLQASGAVLDVGAQAGGVGTVNLAAGSTLEDNGAIVGDAGAGSFYNNGGTHTVGTALTAANLILGNQATGAGTYDNNGGVNTVYGELIVGAYGTGTYNLGNGHPGATLNVDYVGNQGLTGDVYVGENGTGSIVASDGAIATVQGVLALGGPSPNETGTGSLTVTGAGTKWINQSQVQIGDGGTGVVLVQQGGYFESDPGAAGTPNASPSGTSAVIGYSSGGTSCDAGTGATGCVTVDGAGSEWKNAGSLKIGGTGAFGAGPGTGLLTISNGGLVIDNADVNGTAASVGWQSGSAGFVVVESGSTWTNTGDLVVGDGGAGNVNLMGGSTVSVSGFTFVGGAGAGSFFNDGSTHTTQDLVIGQQSDSTGQYLLSDGGALTVGTVASPGFMDVGESGTGAFTQTDSTSSTTVYGALDVGRYAGGSGAVDLEGGTMTVSSFATVGDSGTGVFTQSGGSTVTIDGELDIGRGQSNTGGAISGTGTYNLSGDGTTLNVDSSTIDLGSLAGTSGKFVQSGGTVSTGGETIGDGGTGEWDQSAGLNHTNGNLVVGNQATGNGTYTLSGGSLTLADSGAEFVLGNATGAQGAFNYSGGTVNFASGQNLDVGFNGTGVVHQSGGDLNLFAAGASLDIAKNAGSFGQYYLTGGRLETGSLDVGDAGSGQFNESGGAATVNGDLVAANGAGSGGTVYISGGSLTVTGSAQIGKGANGSFTMEPGAIVDIQGSMTIGTTGGATGGAGIEGGALTVGDELLINAGSSMKIEDTSGSAATVTVDGALVNNGELNLGLHDIASASKASTLTVTNGFTNNSSFGFEANSVLNANVTNKGYFSSQGGNSGGGYTSVTLNGNMDNNGTVNVSYSGTAGSTLTQNGNFTNESGAKLQVQGSTLTINGSAGGTALDNKGDVTISKNYIPSSVTVNGTDAVNEAGAKIEVTDSTVRWNVATFTNNGAYVSDPSTQTFTGDLVNGATGYLVGGAGDTFIVEGNFLSTSTQSTLWNTTQATIEFGLAGSGTDHTFDVTGLDFGAGSAGFTNNFAWGDLTLDPNNTITMVGTGTGPDALYVDVLTGLAFSNDGVITNLASDGVNIYYDASLNPSLDGQNYALSGGGELIAVGGSSAAPEPSTWALMFLGFGGLGFAAYRRARAARALAV